MVGDTVGDFVVRLKNAGMVGHDQVSLPYSKLRHAIADKLAHAGYVSMVETAGDTPATKMLTVALQYTDGEHKIRGIKRVSKPGRRLYAKASELHPVKFGQGHLILSTPAGILTNTEAKEQNVGGEQLFIIW
jgi:small subunit ribosomal protein S8